MESQFTARMIASRIRQRKKARCEPIRSTLRMVDSTTMAARAARRKVTSGTADQKTETKHQASSAISARGTALSPRWNAAANRIGKRIARKMIWRSESPGAGAALFTDVGETGGAKGVSPTNITKGRAMKMI